MHVIVGYRRDEWNGRVVDTYPKSLVRVLRASGIRVTEVGPGHPIPNLPSTSLKGVDLVLEVECGRGPDGSFCFSVPDLGRGDMPPSAVWFIDSHGQGTLHASIAPQYDHVFFAVWSKRDLFAGHPSAHFCPNAVDPKFFGRDNFQHIVPQFDFGFFGSKGGLDRADHLKRIAGTLGWTHDVAEVGKPHRHKWPMTAERMSGCRVLFNHGQKHDLNLRIFESMAVGRPLVNDRDPASGIDKLFQPGVHYLPYESYTYKGLEQAMGAALNLASRDSITEAAYDEVMANHTVANRAAQIMEVTCQ